MSNFMGKNGFQWFVGVVEDRQDPKHLGRVRVRCLGYHTEIHGDLPTADLPWAHPMNPITSATVSGIGQTPLGVVEGTWVVGFFQDGADAQMPVIMGTLPGVPSGLPTKDSDKGFQDRSNANYPKYKETDVNRLAVNEKKTSDLPGGAEEEINPHSTLTLRRADVEKNIGRADFNAVDIQVANSEPVALPADDGTNFNEPTTDYNAKYPHNHVMETESGHITEYDDTPDYERIHLYHRAGTSIEMINTPDLEHLGNRIDKTVGDYYSSKDRNSQEIIQFHKEETIGGHYKLLVNQQGIPNQHFTIQVGSGSNINLQIDNGSLNMFASTGMNFVTGGNFDITCLNYQLTTLGSKVENINGSSSEFVIGPNTKTGNPLNLN